MGFILACLLLGCDAPPPERCTVRVAVDHVRVDGDRLSTHDVLAICQKRRSAILIVEAGASTTTAREIRLSLERAGVEILVRDMLDDRAPKLDDRLHKQCLDNPLAKGCH